MTIGEWQMTDNCWSKGRNKIISLAIVATMTACNAKPVPTSQLNSNNTQKVPPVAAPIQQSKTGEHHSEK